MIPTHIKEAGMSWFRDLFKPRPDNFTRLLIDQAACVVDGLDALAAYVAAAEAKPADARPAAAKATDGKAVDAKAGDARTLGGKAVGPKAADASAIDKEVPDTGIVQRQTPRERAVEVVRQCEEDADEVRRILLNELNRTFVTPMDREDISALSRAIDDIMDYAWTTVQEMEMLHVMPTPHLRRMVGLLREAAHEVHLAMQRIKEHPGVAAEHAQRAKALENRVEHVYREALAELFDGPAGPKRVIMILKMREVYRHLSNAADRGDEAANIISDIVVKMT
jgi:uncharacterized protein Yka (UPF0111/DUF47 family)